MSEIYKIITIGNNGIGKTCIYNRFVDNFYDQSFPSTIGVDFRVKTIKSNDKEYKLQMWDLAGLDKFKIIIRPYFRDAHGVILVYDITNKDSFNELSRWIDELSNFYNLNDKKNSPIIILVGNKYDLNNSREVSSEEAKQFVEKHLIDGYIECSAKNNYQISELFDILLDKLSKKNEQYSDNIIRLPDKLNINNENTKCMNQCCNII